MAEILSRLLSFPPATPTLSKTSDVEYDKQICVLYSDLKRIPALKLVADIPGRGSLLELLDPSTQTLAYLFVLLSHYQVSQEKTKESLPAKWLPGGEIWRKSVALLDVFDPIQVRYAGQEWRSLVDMVAKSAEVASRPLLALRPLKQAILRLDPSSSTFTSLHTTFVRLCLQSRSYLNALDILDKPIYHFPTASDKQFIKRSQLLPCQQHESSMSFITTASGLPGKINHRSYLEYFLYGAMVYIGLRKWDAATHFLEVVISAPTTNSVSIIMVEAYKKWVLLGLVEMGKPLSMPKTVTPFTAKAYRSLAKPYDALADIFKSGNLSRLQAEITAGERIWLNDNNMGLVSQVLAAYQRFSIVKLEKTFAALSIPDITSYLRPGVPMTDTFVAGLITAGQLRACLMHTSESSTPAVLRFTSSTSVLGHQSEVEFSADIITQKNRLETLLRNVHGTDVKLELGREYIESLRKAPRGSDIDSKDKAMAWISNGAIDEDLMGDFE
ncbi:conserved hypothetical protein [Histoplasma capsulatum G186AR]|uniref:COP9 signalosome complex subunit 3 N-terminal helical repeats domain-containing protein n=2 Tax=Ajellomyces capsulatus TaxID=5037 RepID=C0NMG0_AJECG|nr:uncharacterized protein HCBG_04690 [Histoplasma capsulatum G186AR]EEH07811.1 conserved hypothetical protein [Histoplasma capsulatum G186AR]KAG5304040.1 COP9 signalosome complex subunit 3 [Histoplasma capsulatum]QSS69638.1 COP9 signalosome complex subunit 3 [Histoplasma capsulatum G186AR]